MRKFWLAVPPGAALIAFAAVTWPEIARPGDGVASWYCDGFAGRKTASGETYRCDSMTAAAMGLPFGTLVEVTNTRNGKRVTVCINNRGGFERLGRAIDLAREPARQLGLIERGVGKVATVVVGRLNGCEGFGG